MTRERAIDEAVRRIMRFWHYPISVLHDLLSDGLSEDGESFKARPFWTGDIRAEFRRIISGAA